MRSFNFLICIAALYISGCKHDEQVQPAEAKYTVTNPILKDTLVYHEYVSQIHSIQHIELRTLERGFLQKIYVDEGQSVKEGQILFQILPILNEAEVQKARAELSFAKIEYKNTKNLSDQKVVSINELALSEANLNKAKAELSLAEAHLKFTEIRAPFDGIIGRFNDVRLGSLVDEGELLTTLSDNSKMWVYFNLPEAEYLNYITGPNAGNHLPVKLQLANHSVFAQEGIIETIEADFNNDTGNIAFRATFLNPKGILRNGQTGNILMPIPHPNALMIPQKATFEILNKKYVYVVDKDDVIQSREIKIKSELQHIYELETGLNENDRILIEGIRKVKNGETIDPQFKGQRRLWAELNQLFAE